MPCQARHDKLQTRYDIKDGLFRQLHKTFEIRGAINYVNAYSLYNADIIHFKEVQ